MYESMRPYDETFPHIKTDIERIADCMEKLTTGDNNNLWYIAQLLDSGHIEHNLLDIKESIDNLISILDALRGDLSAAAPGTVRPAPDPRRRRRSSRRRKGRVCIVRRLRSDD